LALEARGEGAPADRAREVIAAGKRAELSIVFCDDAMIHALNRDYRKQDKPTDVLSFAQEVDGQQPFPDPVPHGQLPDHASPPISLLLGDVILSTDTAKRQARAGGRSLAAEVEWLLAHGLLHLLGYEDETECGAVRMEARGRAVMEQYAAKALDR
jgi:probable rRNA maturation factor